MRLWESKNCSNQTEFLSNSDRQSLFSWVKEELKNFSILKEDQNFYYLLMISVEKFQNLGPQCTNIFPVLPVTHYSQGLWWYIYGTKSSGYIDSDLWGFPRHPTYWLTWMDLARDLVCIYSVRSLYLCLKLEDAIEIIIDWFLLHNKRYSRLRNQFSSPGSPVGTKKAMW